jgi:hypothetical protein
VLSSKRFLAENFREEWNCGAKGLELIRKRKGEKKNGLLSVCVFSVGVLLLFFIFADLSILFFFFLYLSPFYCK